MSVKTVVPKPFDLKKLKEIPGPYIVRLAKRRSGAPDESHSVGKPFLTEQEILGLEDWVKTYLGSGCWVCQIQGSNQAIYDWGFLLTPPQPGDQYQRDQQQQAAAAQQAQAPVMPPPGVFAGAGAAPAWQQPPQPQWGFDPRLGGGWGQPQPQQPQWGPQAMPPPQSPFGYPPSQQQWPGMYGAGAPPAQAPWWMPSPSQMPFWQPPMPQLPQQVVPTGAVGSPQLEAEVAALKRQNEQLREDTIRRQANEAVNALGVRLEAYQAKSDQRFEQLLEKLSARPGAEVDAKLAFEKQLQHEREERLRAEGQRRDEDFKREIATQAERTRDAEARFQQQLAQAKEQNNGSMMQMALDRIANLQAENAKTMKETMERYMSRDLKPSELIALLQQSQGKDPTTQKVVEAAIENLLNGGSGQVSMPQVVGQLGEAVIKAGQGITQAYFEGKSAEERHKMLQEAKAQQRIEATLRAQQQQAHAAQVAAQAQLAAAANGVANPNANGVSANGVKPSANAQPVVNGGAPVVVEEGEDTAEAILEREERPYFGDAYSHVKMLRAAVAGGQLSPDAVVRAICEAAMAFISFNIVPPVFKDFEQDMTRAITRLLPDAPGEYRREVIEKLPAALKAVVKAAEEEMQEDDGEPEEAEPAKAS
jgi:hypothetical protein